MPNKLEIGEPRYGSLANDDPDARRVSATLERTREGIYLSLTFDHDESPEYAAWFTRGIFDDFIAPNNDTRPAPSPPSLLLFEDSYGPVALIGCRTAGYHHNFQIGSGRIAVGAAVLSAPSTAHARLTGMRAEISGLRAWLHASAISRKEKWDRDTGVQEYVEYKVVVPEAITIPDSNLLIRHSVRRADVEGSVVLENLIRVEHKTTEETSWRAHQLAMRPIRDLLAVSRWRPESFIPISVARLEDSIPGATVEAERRQWWRDVIDSSAPEPKEENRKLEHLISWEDIGPEGLARWIKLRDNFSRAIDPAVSSIYLNDVTVEVRLMQVAIGLEALGYLLAMRRDGASESKASKMWFNRRLDRIVRDVEGLLPFIDDGWSQRMADTYNAVKHANRALPEVVDVANSWRECALLFRAWVANELGVNQQELKTRIARSPQMRSWVAVED